MREVFALNGHSTVRFLAVGADGEFDLAQLVVDMPQLPQALRVAANLCSYRRTSCVEC